MSDHKPYDPGQRGDRLADLLLPYCLRTMPPADIDHEIGWWFRAAPPAAARMALALAGNDPDERPNDQPPEQWLVDQAEQRDGYLAGFVAPKGPFGPRMRIDTIIVPVAQGRDLAGEIAGKCSIDGTSSTALDIVVVEGLATPDAARLLWQAGGYEFAPQHACSEDWLDAAFCSFWWD